MKNAKQKLWSGRFAAELDEIAERFNDSLPFDKKMYDCDIEGSIAHCAMLAKCGIISDKESSEISAGLAAIKKDIQIGALQINGAEDIHSFVETELVERIGETGKKLHTARSRNDQVATDIRLFVRRSIDGITALLKTLIKTLCELAEREKTSAMPAYTHMQKAQPTTLGHYLLAYANMFARDIDRFNDCRRRVNVLPLGCGACASTTFPIDREYTAKLLGFDGICQNSLDGVSDRDFAIEYLSCAATLSVHLSRINEELVYFSGEEFGFVKLPDEFSTGSSIMPQKKNPDVSELLRGKTGRIFGDLVTLLTVMKGLPLAYNKDMQEDKEPIFDADETLTLSLAVFTAMLKSLSFDRERMRSAAAGGFSCATEVADYLAAKGMPFREAHGVVGKIVMHCSATGSTLQDLPLNEYKRFSPLFDEKIFDAVNIDNAIARRCIAGGCAPAELDRQIKLLKSSYCE